MTELFEQFLQGSEPILALAPMQDVTDLAFWRLLNRYGAADVFFTEYFRVYPNSHADRWILQSITKNPTGRPVVAQMIGHDIPSLVRTARQLQTHAVAGIDLNLGCPAPVVYRKCAGGGLLRELDRVDAILGALREAVTVKLTVKTRVGFDSPAVFDNLLTILSRHSLDLVTVHGRTVKEMYRGGVHYDLIARAVAALPCPVLANGNVSSAANAAEILRLTGARGLMIGRGAIRNPWIFTQIRQHLRGEPVTLPRGREVLDYVQSLHAVMCSPEMTDSSQVARMKKFMNYLGAGVDREGRFLHGIRRVATTVEFFRLCHEFLDHDEPMALEPFDQTEMAAEMVGAD